MNDELNFVVFEIVIEFVEYNFEPNRVNIRILNHVLAYFFDAHPFPTFDFFRINLRFVIIITNHHMIEFVFGQTIVEWRFVYKMEQNIPNIGMRCDFRANFSMCQ